MGKASSSGFTIIETVLFLGVTGLLILSMVGGVGASISIQRYRDAVQTFKSLVQQQYAELNNVENGRAGDFTCTPDARPVEDPANGDLRGQSDCMVAGRYMRIEGSDISLYTVLATERASVIPAGANDISVMSTNYVFNAATKPERETQLEWGTKIAWPQVGKEGGESVQATPVRTLGILFVRSPHSGNLYTFTSNSIPAKNSINNSTFASMITASAGVPGRAARVVCIESDGLFVEANQSLFISRNAINTSSIETRTNQIIKDKGGTTEC